MLALARSLQVHLGGAVGMRPDWGRKLRGHKVTSEGLTDYVVRLVENYREGREDGEQLVIGYYGHRAMPLRAEEILAWSADAPSMPSVLS